MKLKKGDTVKVIAGKDKNKEGKGCPCMKGPKAEILPVKPEVEKK